MRNALPRTRSSGRSAKASDRRRSPSSRRSASIQASPIRALAIGSDGPAPPASPPARLAADAASIVRSKRAGVPLSCGLSRITFGRTARSRAPPAGPAPDAVTPPPPSPFAGTSCSASRASVSSWSRPACAAVMVEGTSGRPVTRAHAERQPAIVIRRIAPPPPRPSRRAAGACSGAGMISGRFRSPRSASPGIGAAGLGRSSLDDAGHAIDEPARRLPFELLHAPRRPRDLDREGARPGRGLRARRRAGGRSARRSRCRSTPRAGAGAPPSGRPRALRRRRASSGVPPAPGIPYRP